MLTIEVRLDGRLFAQIRCKNESKPGTIVCVYSYIYYAVQDRKVVTGSIEHDNSETTGELLSKIALDANGKLKELIQEGRTP